MIPLTMIRELTLMFHSTSTRVPGSDLINISLWKISTTMLGIPLSKQELEAKCNANIMLTTYFSLWKALPMVWKRELENSIKDNNMRIRANIALITLDKKGTKNIRKVWVKKDDENIPAGQIKWTNEFGINDWKYLYSIPYKCKMNARLIYFQYQVLHRSLITNKKLLQFGIKDNGLCKRCGEEETISHLLYLCQQQRVLWQEVTRWLNSIFNNTIFTDEQSITLGNKNNELIINYVFIVVKHEIYKSKWNRTIVNLPKNKKTLKYYLETDIFIGTMKNTLPKTLGKWSSLYNNIKDY